MTTRIRIPKAQVFDLMQYEIHAPEVADFHNSDARIRVMGAPARTSKSKSGAADQVAEGLPSYVSINGTLFPEKEVRSWTIGPDYTTNKEFQYEWEWLVDLKLLEGLGGRVENAYNTPNQGNMRIVGNWGRDAKGKTVRSIWEGKSATNERSLQGEEVDNWLQSEAADQIERIWAKYGRTRAGRAVFPTTPKVGGYWVYKMMSMEGVDSFTFTPRANPTYDWDRFWFEHAAAESALAGRVLTEPGGHECLRYSGGKVTVNPECRAAEDPDFAEQFLGQWTFQQGRILPFNWEEIAGQETCHVVHEDPHWLGDARAFWAFDYGYDHPYVGGLWLVSPTGQLYLHDSFYESRLSDPQVAELVREKNEQLHDLCGITPERYSGDPRRPEVGKMLETELGVAVYASDKRGQSDRAAGHRLVVNLLRPHPATNQPGLIIHARNEQVIGEFRELRVKPGFHANEWGTTAILGADHGFDMTKYAAFVAKYMKPDVETDRDWYAEHRSNLRRAAFLASRARQAGGSVLGESY